MQKSTSIAIGFVLLSLLASVPFVKTTVIDVGALLRAPSEFAVEYHFPPETQEGISLQPEVHNYVLCSQDGLPNILQDPAVSDENLFYWIQEEPPQYARKDTKVGGEPPSELFKKVGDRFTFQWNTMVNNPNDAHFYSKGVLVSHPNLAEQSTLQSLQGGVLYYVGTANELPFRCGEDLLCGNRTCDEGENELVCPPDEPCRKVCEDDCGKAPEVQTFCLPCGDSCHVWNLGSPRLECSPNNGLRCSFSEEGECKEEIQYTCDVCGSSCRENRSDVPTPVCSAVPGGPVVQCGYRDGVCVVTESTEATSSSSSSVFSPTSSSSSSVQEEQTLEIIDPVAQTNWETNVLHYIRWTAPTFEEAYPPFGDAFTMEYSLDNKETWLLVNQEQTVYRNNEDEYTLQVIVFASAEECLQSTEKRCTHMSTGFPQMVVYYGLRADIRPLTFEGDNIPRQAFMLPEGAQQIHFRVTDPHATSLTDDTAMIILDLPSVDSSSSSSSSVASQVTLSSSSSSSVSLAASSRQSDPPQPVGQCSDCQRCGEGLTNFCDASECDDLGPCRFTDGIFINTCQPDPNECKNAAGQCSDCQTCGDGLANLCDETECGNLGPCDFIAGVINGCIPNANQCEEIGSCVVDPVLRFHRALPMKRLVGAGATVSWDPAARNVYLTMPNGEGEEIGIYSYAPDSGEYRDTGKRLENITTLPLSAWDTKRNVLYIVGGMHSVTGATSDAIYKYNPTSDTLNIIAHIPLVAEKKYQILYEPTTDRLYVIGTHRSENVPKVWAIDLASSSVRTLEEDFPGDLAFGSYMTLDPQTDSVIISANFGEQYGSSIRFNPASETYQDMPGSRFSDKTVWSDARKQWLKIGLGAMVEMETSDISSKQVVHRYDQQIRDVIPEQYTQPVDSSRFVWDEEKQRFYVFTQGTLKEANGDTSLLVIEACANKCHSSVEKACIHNATASSASSKRSATSSITQCKPGDTSIAGTITHSLTPESSPYPLLYSPSNNGLYNLRYGSMAEINPQTTTWVRSTIRRMFSHAIGAAIEPNAEFAYVADDKGTGLGIEIKKIQLSDLSVVDAWENGSRNMVIDPNGTYMYIVHDGYDARIEKVNVLSKVVIDTVWFDRPESSRHTKQIVPDWERGVLYVRSNGLDQIAVVHLNPFVMSKSLKYIERADSFAIDTQGEYGYAVFYNGIGAFIIKIRLSDMSHVQKNAFDDLDPVAIIAYNGRIFVVSRSNIHIYNAQSMDKVKKIPLPVAKDPQSNRGAYYQVDRERGKAFFSLPYILTLDLGGPECPSDPPQQDSSSSVSLEEDFTAILQEPPDFGIQGRDADYTVLISNTTGTFHRLGAVSQEPLAEGLTLIPVSGSNCTLQPDRRVRCVDNAYSKFVRLKFTIGGTQTIACGDRILMQFDVTGARPGYSQRSIESNSTSLWFNCSDRHSYSSFSSSIRSSFSGENPLRACSQSDSWTTVSTVPYNTYDGKINATGVFENSLVTDFSGLHQYSRDQKWYTIADDNLPAGLLVVRGNAVFLGRYTSYASHTNIGFDVWSKSTGLNRIDIPGLMPRRRAAIEFNTGDYIAGIYADTTDESFYIKKSNANSSTSTLHLVTRGSIEPGKLFNPNGFIEQRMTSIPFSTAQQNLIHNGVEYEVSTKGAIRCRTSENQTGERGIFGKLPTVSGQEWITTTKPNASLAFNDQCTTSDTMHVIKNDTGAGGATYACKKYTFAHNRLYCGSVVFNTRHPNGVLENIHGFFVIEGGQRRAIRGQALLEIQEHHQRSLSYKFFVADNRVFVGTWWEGVNQDAEIAIYEISQGTMAKLGSITIPVTNVNVEWSDVEVISGTPYALTNFGQIVQLHDGSATIVVDSPPEIRRYRDAVHIEVINSTLYLAANDALYTVNGSTITPVIMEYYSTEKSINDMIAIGNILYIAIGDTIMQYNTATATWADTDLAISTRFSGEKLERILDVHNKGNDLIVRTSNRLLQYKNDLWYVLQKKSELSQGYNEFGVTDQFIYETYDSDRGKIFCSDFPEI